LGTLGAVAEERKYCPSEVDHGGKLKELAGSFRLAGERRFRCVVTNCTNNTRAFSDVENESRIVPRFFVALRYLAIDYVRGLIGIYIVSKINNSKH